MKRFTPAILAAALLMFFASACKRSQTNEPAAAAEDPPAAAEDPPAVAEDPPAAAEDQPAASTDDQAATDRAPSAAGRTIEAIPLPADWIKVSSQTPKGVTVSFGVPSEWVELPPPNESTLLVRGAPYKIAAGGTKATAVVVEFAGARTALADHIRQRLSGLAAVQGEGPLRVGSMDGYEFVVRWSGPSGDRDTVQLLLATGDEAIAVTCELLPDQLETLRGLCDEIFATVSLEGAKAQK